MKVLVTGDRLWTDRAMIEAELSKFPSGTIIIHGGARGADTIAGEVAQALGFVVRVYYAEWTKHGRKAGPIRNATMLKREHILSDPINLLLVFHRDLSQSKGTRDMVEQTKKWSIPMRFPALVS
jgi:hypothetical protein